MTHPDPERIGVSRRSVLHGLVGIGGAGAIPAAAVAEAGASTDPHTADTYRSIADAIVPSTPALADELGDEHEAGALDVDLEDYLVWSFNNFHEIRTGLADDVLDTVVRAADLDVDLGVVVRFEVRSSLLSSDYALTVETDEGTFERSSPNYPYAEAIGIALDVVAAEFVARGKNREAPRAVGEFPAGGIFARLAPRDRLRTIESIIDGGIVDDLDDVLDDVLPHVGILKFVAFGLNAFVHFGYYSEWSGYGGTKTDPPNERELVEDVQSHAQTGYPGPSPGYAALRDFPGDGVFELNEDGFTENDY
ncbi:hypothetical protein [Halegenticoccus tardaugens]|uniref:hypothetical protein n=1 Tax=Halegenticoccus tardaugens TaxID=2071624 RepID=UPI00100C11DC|nr:hypothetical protein [Halegenticoccus tardaugens]